MNVSYSLVAILSIVSAATLFPGCSNRSTVPPSDSAWRASCFDVAAGKDALHLVIGRLLGTNKAVELSYVRIEAADHKKWTEIPIPTTHAPAGNHHRGNDPQIAIHGERIMALWTAKGGGPFGSGPIGIALSDDGGKTWRPGPSPTPPADASRDVGYRFPATTADNTAFHAVWIHAEGDERSLRHSRLDFGSEQWTPPSVIDSDCCACCWNEMKTGPDGKVFALYRDEEPKDMALAVSDDQGHTWKRTGVVGKFDWEFNGCPHVGGAFAFPDDSSKLIQATIWTGHPDHTGAYALASRDGGESWSAPFRLQTAGEQGRHADIAVLSATESAMVWDQRGEEERIVYASHSTDGGGAWTEAKQLSRPGVKSEYPRVAVCDGRFLALWSEYEEGKAPLIRIEEISSQPR